MRWKFIKWGTGLLSLYLDRRLRKPKKRRALDVLLIDMLMDRLLAKPTLLAFSEQDQQKYLAAVKDAVYWHGTGGFQHGERDKAVNVLEQTLKQGGMRPFKDLFDIKEGEMFSISVARQRMYARIYGDMHEYQGADLHKRYGSPRFWAYYFIMAINLHATRELGLWDPKTRRVQHATWRKQGGEWASKVRMNPGSATGKFFDNGSDIKGNYPIIIGIKRGKYTLLKTADYVARYESRIGSNIAIENFTHLEVPQNKQAEVKRLLKKYGCGDIPVFAFEQCEMLHARKRLSELVAQSK